MDYCIGSFLFASVVNSESGKSFHGMMGLFYFEFSIMLATQSKLIEIHFTEISFNTKCSCFASTTNENPQGL